MTEEKPYQDEELLRKMYWEDEMSMQQIGDELGCNAKTIHTYIHRYDIGSRDRSEAGKGTKGPDSQYEEYRNDPQWLYEKYWDEGKTCEEISDIIGCGRKAVESWMKEHDISLFQPPVHRFDVDGYERVENMKDGKTYCVKIHRLVAVAEYGVDVVKKNHVHHKNEFKMDNRPSNLEVKSPHDHISDHVSDAERADSGEIISW